MVRIHFSLGYVIPYRNYKLVVGTYLYDIMYASEKTPQ